MNGRLALVTGSTSGIGEAVALSLAAGGADVVVHGRDRVRGQRVVEQVGALGRRAVFVPAELREPAECARLVATAVEEFGRLDIIVNNAAATLQAGTEQTPLAALDELFAVNVRAPYLLVQAALPRLRVTGEGVVINITGSPAYRGAPAASAFAASKAALHSLTRSWAAELGPLGIRVNEISPGATDTRLSRPMLADPERRAAIEQRIPARRIGVPAEIAAAVGYLVSEQARYVNGTTLAVDGGLLA